MPKYDILSPDGIALHVSNTYSTISAAIKKFNKWKKQFEFQGYYSSNRGRIPLAELAQQCTLVTMERGQNLMNGAKSNLQEEIDYFNQNKKK